ncbi:MAG: hypothetical protein Q8L87_10025 [Anaerolineales bacterium]|nr:hypothetical protein [Anaerolineales bacterium]
MSDNIVSDDAKALSDSVSIHTKAMNRGFIAIVSLTLLIAFGVPKEGIVSLFGIDVRFDLIQRYFIFIISLVNINYCMNRVLAMDASFAYFSYIRANDPAQVLFSDPTSKVQFTRADLLHRLHESSLDRIYPLFSMFSRNQRSKITIVIRPIIEFLIAPIPYIAIYQTYDESLLGWNIYSAFFFAALAVSLTASIICFIRAIGWGIAARD